MARLDGRGGGGIGTPAGAQHITDIEWAASVASCVHRDGGGRVSELVVFHRVQDLCGRD